MSLGLAAPAHPHLPTVTSSYLGLHQLQDHWRRHFVWDSHFAHRQHSQEVVTHHLPRCHPRFPVGEGEKGELAEGDVSNRVPVSSHEPTHNHNKVRLWSYHIRPGKFSSSDQERKNLRAPNAFFLGLSKSSSRRKKHKLCEVLEILEGKEQCQQRQVPSLSNKGQSANSRRIT